MSLINFRSSSRFNWNQNRIASFTVVIMVSAFFLFKSTFAANITLNNGQTVEYGQGVSQATACSGGASITITPTDAFNNASGGGSFTFNGFTVSNVPTSCQGDTLQINAYNATNNSALSLYQTTSSDVKVMDGSGSFSLPSGTIGLSLISLSATSFSVSFANPVAGGSTVYKLGIQSYPSVVVLTCAQGGTCNVGDTGPGGGIVYYTSVSAFTETGATCSANCHYLEYAPSGWYSGNTDGQVWWSSDATHLSTATGTALGTGFGNTTAMLTSSGSYVGDTNGAAYISHQYAGNDSSAGQWFLPSIDELILLANSSAKSAGSFANNWYWSSSDSSNLSAQGENLLYPNGTQGKTYNGYVRPVRAF